MRGTVNNLLLLLGRIAISLIFIGAAVGKMMDWQGSVAYMTAKHMPMIPFFLAGAIFLEFVGGVSVLLGIKARAGALLLIIFLIPAALIFHGFWNITDPTVRMLESMFFMKDLAILGGLLYVFVHGAGALAITNN